MDQVMYYSIITGVVTFVLVMLLGGLTAIIGVISKIARMKKNPFDIEIYEFNGNSCIIRNEIGRYFFHDDYGKCIVTAAKGSKIKENLGNHISENEILPVANKGIFRTNRKKITVAVKDGVFVPLQFTEKELDLSEVEKKVLNSLKSKYNDINVRVLENPRFYGLKPIKAEQTRFVLDVNKELQEQYRTDKFAEIIDRLSKAILPIFVVGFIVLLIMFIVLFAQGPSIAEAVRSPLPPG